MIKKIQSILANVLVINLIFISSLANITFAEITSDIAVPEFSGTGLDKENSTLIPGYYKGYELIINSIYKDISGNPYEEDITRMAALGIIKKQGDFNYRPAEDITGYEALTYLVRLSGNEEVVEQRIITNSLGMSIEGVKSFSNEEYLNEARTLGIIEADEERNLTGPVSREVLGSWTARAINLDPVYGNNENIFGFTDWGEVTPLYRGFVESLVTERIMTMGNDGNFRPKANVSRGEAARVLKRASRFAYANMGITENFGLLTAIDNSFADENGEKINYKDFYIRNVSGDLIDVKTSKNTVSGKQEDFAVFKGTMTSSRMLAIGDEVEYLVRDNQVIYANIIKTESLIEKLSNSKENNELTTIYFGTVKDVINSKSFENGKFIETRRVRVQNFDGGIFDITVDTETYTGNKNDIIVFRGEMVGGIEILEKGDQIEYLVKNNKDVIYISQKPYKSSKASGTVRDLKNDGVGSNRITIFDYDNQIIEYPIASYASVVVNMRNGNLDDLKPGQDVDLTINHGYVTSINSETFVDNPGYIPEEGKIRMGEIYYVYNDGALVKLNDGSTFKYKLKENTVIIKGGNDISYRALKAGDKVKLYFSSIYTDVVDKVEVEGIEKLIKHIYRGEMVEINEITKTITLKNPRYLKNDNWELLGEYSKEILIDNKTQLYAGDNPIPMRKLSRNFKGKTIYVVVEDVYGKERGAKLAVKTGGEQIEYDSIKRIDKPINSFETFSRVNIEMTDGTIILKDGKLVGDENLDLRDNVLVVYEETPGSKQANVIKIVTSREDIFSKVYMGALEFVGPTKIALSYYTSISNNMFNEVEINEKERYTLTNGSVIKDVTDPKNIKRLTLNRFFNSNYEREANDSKDDKGLAFERYYALFVLNEDDQIIQINLRHKGLVSKQNIDDKVTKTVKIKDELSKTLEDFIFTRGIVDSIDDTWERVKMTDSNDWTGKLGEWTINSVDTYFEFDEADTIFIKDDRVASRDDVEVGDTLYLLRLKEKAYVVFIEEE